MRLINADRLLTDRMKSKYYHLPNGDTAIPIIDIEHAPTIDAVEVVRCKDCRHWRTSYCVIHGDSWEETDYCSDGEREGKR